MPTRQVVLSPAAVNGNIFTVPTSGSLSITAPSDGPVYINVNDSVGTLYQRVKIQPGATRALTVNAGDTISAQIGSISDLNITLVW